jgi:hypothetical protein
MNKVLLSIIITSLLTYKSVAQTIQEQQVPIIPLAEYLVYMDDETSVIPNDAYFKDVDGDLTKYIGTWKGTVLGKTYEFRIIKLRRYYDNISIDELEMRYSITDASSNQELASTLDLPADSPYIVTGEHLATNRSSYLLYYIGLESKCGQNGYLGIKVANNSATTLTMKYVLKGEKSHTCTYTASQIFPIEQDMIFIKQ